jgi:hypothetical protein
MVTGKALHCWTRLPAGDLPLDVYQERGIDYHCPVQWDSEDLGSFCAASSRFNASGGSNAFPSAILRFAISSTSPAVQGLPGNMALRTTEENDSEGVRLALRSFS